VFGNYLKMAWKVFARRRFFTFVSLFGIGFTLTVVMGVTAMIDATLAPGYPEAKLDRLLTVKRMMMRGEHSAWVSSAGYRLLDEYMRDLPGVEAMTIYSKPVSAVSFADGRKILSQLRYTDDAYWRIMDFEFDEGGPYAAADAAAGTQVAVIDEGTRRRFFGEDPALGRTFDLDGREFRVMGVVRDVPVYRDLTHANIWVSLGVVQDQRVFRSIISEFYGSFLLAPGADAGETQAAFRERLTRVELPDPENFDTIDGLPMTTLEDLSNRYLDLDMGETAPGRIAVLVMLAVLAFMALPAINLVSINLSRIYERSGEIGVRKAFGASTRDLVGQFVVENVVLCLVGGLIGLAGAWIGLQILAHLPQMPYLDPRFSGRFFAAALGLSVLFGLLSGVGPAWRMSRQHVVTALRGGAS